MSLLQYTSALLILFLYFFFIFVISIDNKTQHIDYMQIFQAICVVDTLLVLSPLSSIWPAHSTNLFVSLSIFLYDLRQINKTLRVLPLTKTKKKKKNKKKQNQQTLKKPDDKKFYYLPAIWLISVFCLSQMVEN